MYWAVPSISTSDNKVELQSIYDCQDLCNHTANISISSMTVVKCTIISVAWFQHHKPYTVTEYLSAIKFGDANHHLNGNMCYQLIHAYSNDTRCSL